MSYKKQAELVDVRQENRLQFLDEIENLTRKFNVKSEIEKEFENGYVSNINTLGD